MRPAVAHLLFALLLASSIMGCVPDRRTPQDRRDPVDDGSNSGSLIAVCEQANRGQRAAWSRLAKDLAAKTLAGDLKSKDEQMEFWSAGIQSITEQKSKVIGAAIDKADGDSGAATEPLNAEKSAAVWEQVAKGIAK
jgi:hypothetical protein